MAPSVGQLFLLRLSLTVAGARRYSSKIKEDTAVHFDVEVSARRGRSMAWFGAVLLGAVLLAACGDTIAQPLYGGTGIAVDAATDVDAGPRPCLAGQPL